MLVFAFLEERGNVNFIIMIHNLCLFSFSNVMVEKDVSFR